MITRQITNDEISDAFQGWNDLSIVKVFSDPYSDYDQITEKMNILKHWCKENIEDINWVRYGVTQYSYRFIFRNKEDALVFKLRFGL